MKLWMRIKVWSMLGCLMLFAGDLHAQEEIERQVEEQVEQVLGKEESATDDDSYVVGMDHLKRHPLNMNEASKDDLEELQLLSPIAIENFINYRHLFGLFLSIYELQAVPGWDPALIRQLLPYVTVRAPVFSKQEWKDMWKKGKHQLLARWVPGSWLNDSVSVNTANKTRQLGSGWKMLWRYRFSHPKIQWGMTAEKDAGEPFFQQGYNYGFDFYSVHIAVRNMGAIKMLVLGDYVINMGQGLVHWQGAAMGRSALTMMIKRQSPVLKPYTSAGEFAFHRGVGITVQERKWQWTGFMSSRKLSATFEVNNDDEQVFTSIRTAGYHRSSTEMAARNKLRQTAGGIVCQWSDKRLKIAVNAVHHHYPIDRKKGEEPYQVFNWYGTQWWNAGIDYSYTWRNMHLFGEMAMDARGAKALLNGVLISVDRQLDLSFLVRAMSPSYQVLSGDAFTSNTKPGNESGIYMGWTFFPAGRLRIAGYTDLARFPWIRYRVTGPSVGTDIFLQVEYVPDKKSTASLRFRSRTSMRDESDEQIAIRSPVLIRQYNTRFEMGTMLGSSLSFRMRTELLRWQMEKREAQHGSMFLADLIYKKGRSPLKLTGRCQWFFTGDYDARMYAFENDLMFSSSLAAVYGIGSKMYVLAGYRLNKKMHVGVRLGKMRQEIESPNGFEKPMLRKSLECRMQVVLDW